MNFNLKERGWLTCITPPPEEFDFVYKNSFGKPIILPNQFITIVSNSVAAGLEAYKNSFNLFLPSNNNRNIATTLTHVKPKQLMPSESMSPKSDGKEFNAGK